MFKYFFLIIFTGSVFIVSDNFVNSCNAPKVYFVILSIQLSVLFFFLSKQIVLSTNLFRKKNLLYGILAICFLQGIYGIFQFLGLFQSNNNFFLVTGSFDNPAGISALLSMGYPIGLFLFFMSKTRKKYFFLLALVTLTITIILSGSRTGVIAILCTLLIFNFNNIILNTFSNNRKYFHFLFGIFVILLVIGFLYKVKHDSANGRLLIWKISCKMIRERPILGHGFGSFKAKYMYYQADYFSKNSDSQDKLLADNICHPFNEFIKITIEFGIAGLFVVFILLFFVLRRIFKYNNKYKHLVLSGISTFLIFANFSYPFQNTPVCILLVFYFMFLFPTTEIRIINTYRLFIIRISFIGLCIYGILGTINIIKAEILWKQIAEKSLKGDTKKVLPIYERIYPYLEKNPYFLYNYGVELCMASEYDRSIAVLEKCKLFLIDYDLLLVLAENYQQKKKISEAIYTLNIASDMIPGRIYPLYKLFNIYIIKGDNESAKQIAEIIVKKEAKVLSGEVLVIKAEAKEYLKSCKNL